MRKSTTNFAAGVWMTFSAVLGTALAVRGVRALLGLAPFAWWHLPMLAASIFFTSEELSPAARSRLAAWFRLTRERAVKSFSNVARAVRGLAALFATRRPSSNPRIQTEP